MNILIKDNSSGYNSLTIFTTYPDKIKKNEYKIYSLFFILLGSKLMLFLEFWRPIRISNSFTGALA